MSKVLSLDKFEKLGYDIQKEEDADKENINCYIIKDGYVFEIEEREDGTQEVVFVAKETKLKPKVIDVHLSLEDSKLKIETTAKRAKEYNFIISSNSELVNQTTENNILEVNLKELDNDYKNTSKNVFGTFTIKVIARNDNNRELNDDNQQYTKSKNINISKVIFDANGGAFGDGQGQFIAFVESGEILNTNNNAGFSTPTKSHNNFDDWYIDNKKIMLDEFIINESIVSISAGWNFIDHDYVYASTLKEATCTEDGEEIKVCTICGDEKHVIIAALGHSYTQESTDDSHIKSTATCQSAAVYYKSCIWCGANNESDTFTSGNVASHSYTSKSKTSAYLKSSATCQAKSVYYYKCKWCSSKGSNTYEDAKADHSYVAGRCKTCAESTGICKWCKRCKNHRAYKW